MSLQLRELRSRLRLGALLEPFPTQMASCQSSDFNGWGVASCRVRSLCQAANPKPGLLEEALVQWKNPRSRAGSGATPTVLGKSPWCLVQRRER